MNELSDNQIKMYKIVICNELLDKVMKKKRTIIDEDGVMYRAVLLKDIEDLKAEVNQ